MQASGRRFDPDRLHQFFDVFWMSIGHDVFMAVDCQRYSCPALLGLGARMFEIVKRQHLRPAGNLVLRTSDGPQPFASEMLGKQKYVFG